MSKKNAALVLSVLVVALFTVNVAAPSLHYFFNVGTATTMLQIGQQVGTALGAAFGGSSGFLGKLLPFVGIVLFLA